MAPGAEPAKVPGNHFHYSRSHPHEFSSTLAISCCGSELIQQDLPILGVKLVGFEWIR